MAVSAAAKRHRAAVADLNQDEDILPSKDSKGSQPQLNWPRTVSRFKEGTVQRKVDGRFTESDHGGRQSLYPFYFANKHDKI